MKGKIDCPHCHGRGVVLEEDPTAPARFCNCFHEGAFDGGNLGIPVRYRAVQFEVFWNWWKMQHPKDAVISQLMEAQRLLESIQNPMAAPLTDNLQATLAHILSACEPRKQGGAWELKAALEPEGFTAFKLWTKNGRDSIDLWWLEGKPGSGRSSMAAAALKACCEREKCPGLFISVRTFSQELKDVYFDTRSYQNKGFQSERDRMDPLQSAPFLVLDDFDRMDSDIRVLRAFAQLLDHRYAEERPTILTASRSFEFLQMAGPEVFPLMKLEDPNLFRRLKQARRVVLEPLLSRLMEKQAQHG